MMNRFNPEQGGVVAPERHNIHENKPVEKNCKLSKDTKDWNDLSKDDKNEWKNLEKNTPDEKTHKVMSSQEDSGMYCDGWKNSKLKNGDKTYQLTTKGGEGLSNYYTDQKTVDSCRDKNGNVDTAALRDKLQIPNNSEYGSKDTLTAYDVKDDINDVGTGKAVENDKLGKGGGKQFYIAPDEANKHLARSPEQPKTNV